MGACRLPTRDSRLAVLALAFRYLPAVPPIPPPRASGYTSTTTVPLYWCRYGEPGAPPLLVLHGGPGAHHDYLLPQMLELARLAGGHELIFYDQRGGGRSKDESRAPVTWRTHVEDLALVIDELGVDPLSIVGYSWGGMLALLYAIDAARNAAMVQPQRLALIDPAPLTREYRDAFEAEKARRERGPAVLAMRDELAASNLRETDPDAYRQRAFELGVSGYFEDPHRAAGLTAFRVTGRVQQQVWESLGDFDTLSELERWLCPAPYPVLITHGRQDPIPLESSERAARALDARFVVLEHCGHVPYVEQPAALFAALDDFLRETRPATP